MLSAAAESGDIQFEESDRANGLSTTPLIGLEHATLTLADKELQYSREAGGTAEPARA